MFLFSEYLIANFVCISHIFVAEGSLINTQFNIQSNNFYSKWIFLSTWLKLHYVMQHGIE